jgi:hypothetical protein
MFYVIQRYFSILIGCHYCSSRPKENDLKHLHIQKKGVLKHKLQNRINPLKHKNVKHLKHPEIFRIPE